MSLDGLLTPVEGDGAIPPLERWQPALSGDMDLLIRADGGWLHDGEPIRRPRLVRLLSTILRREADGDYYLVTPVEKWRIQVEDRPFLIVDADAQGEADALAWHIDTNVGDRVTLGAEHRLVLSETPRGEPVPEVAIRFGLAARLHRNVYYRLIEQAEQRSQPGGIALGLTSNGVWQPLGWLDEAAP
ncbi:MULTISPECIES: DUF1285 domain-containing protein [Halomonadaceae]|uniref:DUF1285 domain-containing protein n=1 Tax=Modicisalibacter zincidurans TaxID=1178777 RepID=A0ABP9RKI3_9GAMM|nr:MULTISPECIES: DUF1285 domain-containing protein [Halomonas]MCD6008832.1 DUF1285 domain-containing protein [Halomonas sp. IOP_31]MEA3250417.1 DUF1285 domain-containing protein [Pseudomonadota bacterium]